MSCRNRAVRRSLASMLAALTAMTSAVCSAAERDRLQPISIQSDRARYEANRGVYEGNVVIEQGSLRIRADRVTVFEQRRSVDRLQAFGRPAHFEQTGNGGAAVRASADEIEYRVVDEQVILLRNATVDHEGSEIHGERIVYSSRSRTVSAEGGGETGSGRVQMILQPRQAEPAAGNTPPNTLPDSPDSDADAHPASP